MRKRKLLSEDEALPILRDIVLGLVHLSKEGFVHRDLKPANIFLQDNFAKIGDFGFTKKAVVGGKEKANVGSPLYMSP